MTSEFCTVTSVAIASTVNRLRRLIGRDIGTDDIEPRNLAFARNGDSLPSYAANDAVDQLQSFARRVCDWWSEYDLLVTPVLSSPPWRLGAVQADLERLSCGKWPHATVIQYTWQFNVTGQPAVSLPVHLTADVLPVGVQLVADQGNDGLLLALSRQLEATSRWDLRHPPVHLPTASGEPTRI